MSLSQGLERCTVLQRSREYGGVGSTEPQGGRWTTGGWPTTGTNLGGGDHVLLVIAQR